MNPEFAARAIADVADTPIALSRLIGAIATGNFEDAASWMTDDAVLDIRGYGRMNGYWRGRDNVVAALRHNFAKVRDQRPVVDATIHSGYTTSILFSEQGVFVADEVPYSVRASLWITYDGERIHRIDEICAAA